MSRKFRKADDLRVIANDLAAAAKRVGQSADAIAEMPEDFPGLLIHGADVEARQLPAVFAWAVKIAGDCEIQIKAFHAGKKSKAHIDKARAKRPK